MKEIMQTIAKEWKSSSTKQKVDIIVRCGLLGVLGFLFWASLYIFN